MISSGMNGRIVSPEAAPDSEIPIIGIQYWLVGKPKKLAGAISLE
jgi:hypothetical protein